MEALETQKAAYGVLQIEFADALQYLWQLPDNFCGEISLLIQAGKFRNSVPPVKGGHLAVKAFAGPLIRGIIGFDEAFDGFVELIVDVGQLSEVVFRDDECRQAFLDWHLTWESEQSQRLRYQGIANRLHGEMLDRVDITEKIGRRVAPLREVNKALIAWAFREITGVTGYTGRVTVRYRDGGIMSTTPAMSSTVNRTKVAKALKSIIPQAGRGESVYFLNRGLLNPK
jgi:hypothetical protein